jgi:hypothetical protein
MVHIVRALFLLEVVVNAFSGPMMMLAPELGLGDIFGTPMADATIEACRWNGSMISAFGSVLLGRALYAEAATLRLVLEAFLVGDVCYTTIVARWCWRQQLFMNPTAAFTVWFSLILGVARVAAVSDIRLAMASNAPHRD